MPIICIILLSFLAIFAFFGLVFLLCKYCLEFSTEKFITKTRKTEKTFSDSFKTIPRSYSTTLPGFERIQQRKSNSYSDQTKTEKVMVGEGKTIPRSYSTTLPGFERIQQRKSNSYSDLLNTEEWRNKKLKIIKRDNCRCTYCGNRFHLHVHHKYYSAYPNGVLVYPWNYPDDALITLCSYCHQRVHARKKIKVYYRRYTDNY